MSEIRLDIQDVVATVTLANPGKLNAINVAMWEALADIFIRLSGNQELRCVIVRGDNGHFAAGADIQEFSSVRNTMELGIRYHRQTIARALQAIDQCIHPTIAAIEGVCVGGGLEIACACDLRIAHPAARFGIPVNRLGFCLAPDELVPLLQLVGKATALEILLEGRVFSAAEAKEKGLLHRIVEDVPGQARAMAQRIAEGAPLAARMNKKLIRRLSPQPSPLTEAEYTEAFSFLTSDDYQEGVRTFLNKTRPSFSGK